MAMDLTGITNQNEYYTNHYFSEIFSENAAETLKAWNAIEGVRTPWSKLRECAKKYYPVHDRMGRLGFNRQSLYQIRNLADGYLEALGYPEATPVRVPIDDELTLPVYLELQKSNGAPQLWVLLSASREQDADILSANIFDATGIDEDSTGAVSAETMTAIPNEDLITRALFDCAEPPRFLVIIGMNQITLIDRNKWNEKRFLQFELEDIFARLENTTLQAMAVLLHHDSLCPEDGKILLDSLDENSQKSAAGVSQSLKYALRECIELLGNEVLYDMKNRKGRDLEKEPVDASQLTLECLRYMYRMLFVLFIESRPELGYAPIREQTYQTGYSLESLRDIADEVNADIDEVGDGYYLFETLQKLYTMIYSGYPESEEELQKYSAMESIHDLFVIQPLKAHIFDPEYTAMITDSKLRNSVMLQIIELMSLTRSTGKKNERRMRISYANLGINQLGAVYEALLSYRGFIAEEDLYEVKRAGDKFDELDVGYFVPERDLDQYEEDERVRYEKGENKGKLRMYPKGQFIYRLAGREREKSASYYTPEVLTKCLVKYALKELLQDKSADDILNLTVCEPAMGSAAFLNEAINQLAEAYLTKKQEELGESIPYDKRAGELQKVKMYIADRNVYGIDLNSVAVELAEVSLWLNTIYSGGYVPWFGTQLVNGNSLIGARRQVYSESMLQATGKGAHWYEHAPDRVPLGTERKKRKGNSQIYHFLLGDTGMCSYSDKVIKSLEPVNIKKMKDWNKKFTAPYTDDEIATLRRLSEIIDELWKEQVALRQRVEEATRDSLSVYGHTDTGTDSHTTIRQKDKILSEIYKSEHMRNAGPYARLKFAMDYWCALWFWPIDKADLLPERSVFLFEMSMILEGTTAAVMGVANDLSSGQMTIEGFDFEEAEQLAIDFSNQYSMTNETVVDIPALRKGSERLNLAAEIAEQNKFMHWELEFADLFQERGGFDLTIGNPPWVRIEWNEKATLSDVQPLFAVKDLSAKETSSYRADILGNRLIRTQYFAEYISIAGEQQFLNASQNYPDLIGMKANLYKCFLPQAWMFSSNLGLSAFVHPDGVYDDPNGGKLRQTLYPRLRMHLQFINELRLFAEVHHSTVFSLNIYGQIRPVSFVNISNLFAASTIEECFMKTDSVGVPGIKDNNGWCIKGHPSRIVNVSKNELSVYAKLLDDSNNWKCARLPAIHAQELMDVLTLFADQKENIGSLGDNVFPSIMWDEAKSQRENVIYKETHFPENSADWILSGPNEYVANPLYKCVRSAYRNSSDYDNIDLTNIPNDYRSRCLFRPKGKLEDYFKHVPVTTWNVKLTNTYRIVQRAMVGSNSERTLSSAIIPPHAAHIDGLYCLALNNNIGLIAGLLASIPYDFYIKATGKSHVRFDILSCLPIIGAHDLGKEIAFRALRLNCLTTDYKDLWKQEYNVDFKKCQWSKTDKRLNEETIVNLSSEWERTTALRSDYERRFAMVEIDVLAAMSLSMTLSQLKTIYKIQFPVLRNYETDTWYDANGRIVFTANRGLGDVGFTRTEWENGIKNANAGQKFYRTITDDTMPGGPVERTIEYVAPFDRCDREQDYETAWKFFEEKYGKEKA